MNEALSLGVELSTPAAIISNASRENQKTIITTLGKLENDSKNAEKPAILVFGDVVRFQETLSATVNNINYHEKIAVDC
jgi:siroheme synthase